MKLALALIRTDGGTQTRAEIDRTVVDDYAEKMRTGEAFPPLVVFYDGEDYWLADGFHRHGAADAAEIANVDVVVRQGTRRDAVLFSVGANAQHGLRRTNADKRRAVETLLADAEWSRKSDNWIATTASVDHKTVARLREHLGIPKCEDRHTADGRVMNVANIGRAPETSHTQASMFTAPAPAMPSAPSPVARPSHDPTDGEYEEDGDDIARAKNPDGLAVVEPEPDPEPEAKPRGWGEHDLSLYVGNMGALMRRCATEAARMSDTVDPRWRDEARERVSGVIADTIDVLLKLMPHAEPRRAALTVIAGGKK